MGLQTETRLDWAKPRSLRYRRYCTLLPQGLGQRLLAQDVHQLRVQAVGADCVAHRTDDVISGRYDRAFGADTPGAEPHSGQLAPAN